MCVLSYKAPSDIWALCSWLLHSQHAESADGAARDPIRTRSNHFCAEAEKEMPVDSLSHSLSSFPIQWKWIFKRWPTIDKEPDADAIDCLIGRALAHIYMYKSIFAATPKPHAHFQWFVVCTRFCELAGPCPFVPCAQIFIFRHTSPITHFHCTFIYSYFEHHKFIVVNARARALSYINVYTILCICSGAF